MKKTIKIFTFSILILSFISGCLTDSTSDQSLLSKYKVEIRNIDGGEPIKAIMVGETATYKASITPPIKGKFQWYLDSTKSKFVSPTNTDTVTVLSEKSSKSIGAEKIRVVFKPDLNSISNIAPAKISPSKSSITKTTDLQGEDKYNLTKMFLKKPIEVEQMPLPTLSYMLASYSNKSDLESIVMLPMKKARKLEYTRFYKVKTPVDTVLKETNLNYYLENNVIIIGNEIPPPYPSKKTLEVFNDIILENVKLPQKKKVKRKMPKKEFDAYQRLFKSFEDGSEDDKKSLEKRFEIACHTYIPIYFEVIEKMSKKNDPRKIGIDFALNNKIDIENELPEIIINNMPLGNLISYICRSANLKYRVESNKIILSK